MAWSKTPRPSLTGAQFDSGSQFWSLNVVSRATHELYIGNFDTTCIGPFSLTIQIGERDRVFKLTQNIQLPDMPRIYDVSWCLLFYVQQTLYLFVALFAPSLALEAGKKSLILALCNAISLFKFCSSLDNVKHSRAWRRSRGNGHLQPIFFIALAAYPSLWHTLKLCYKVVLIAWLYTIL